MCHIASRIQALAELGEVSVARASAQGLNWGLRMWSGAGIWGWKSTAKAKLGVSGTHLPFSRIFPVQLGVQGLLS